MKKTAYLLLATGISLFVGIITWYGAGDIFAALALCGPIGLLIVVASHLIPMVADAIAWRFLITKGRVPNLLTLVKLRWISEAVNAMLPVAQIGGEIARATVLSRKGVPGAMAGASVIVEVTVAILTQIIFTVAGVVVLLFLGENRMALNAFIGMAVLAALIGAFTFLQRMGISSRVAQILTRLGGENMFGSLADSAYRLDEEIRELYKQNKLLIKTAFWRMLGWATGAIEVWLALFFMGVEIGITEAIMLESLSQAIRAAAFLIPGGLGVQEGGLVALCALIGITPDIALGLSLAKRVREITLGLPGLVAWQAEEGKKVFGRKKTDNRPYT